MPVTAAPVKNAAIPLTAPIRSTSATQGVAAPVKPCNSNTTAMSTGCDQRSLKQKTFLNGRFFRSH